MRGAFSARLPASRMTGPRLATRQGVPGSATRQPWVGSSRQRICGAHRLQPAFGHRHEAPKRSRRPSCPVGDRSAQGVSFRLLHCDDRSAPTQNPEVLTVRIDACGTSKASASSRQGRRRERKVNPAPGQRRVPVAGDASQPWWHSVCSGTTSCCHDKQGVSRLAGERRPYGRRIRGSYAGAASPLVRRARHRGPRRGIGTSRPPTAEFTAASLDVPAPMASAMAPDAQAPAVVEREGVLPSTDHDIRFKYRYPECGQIRT